MRSVTMKTNCTFRHAVTTLGHPGAPLGDFRDATLQVRRVANVPDEVSDGEVLRLFQGTTVLDSIDNPKKVIDYAQLGVGRIVR